MTLGCHCLIHKKKICYVQIWKHQKAKNSGDEKSLIVLFFKQDTWEEEQSNPILASKIISLQLAKEV